ncbi:hypothetical protein LTR85_010826 [Meristemomyces frigidus]|nr:hypothetical protein LTR85_010826 [Meristemomyces frigidus]
MDAMFALSALQLTRQEDVPAGDSATETVGPRGRVGMRRNAQMYFDRALDSQRHGVGEDEDEALVLEKTREAAYLTSILLSVYALVALGEPPADDDPPEASHAALVLWLRLSTATQTAYHTYQPPASVQTPVQTALAWYGNTHTRDEDRLYHTEQGRPFTQLLTFAAEYETLSLSDTEIYTKVLSHISHTFKLSNSGAETPLQICQRLAALPSRLPPRFTDLAEARAPRALVMLAHVLLHMKLIENEVPLLRGIAGRQVCWIEGVVPRAWRERMGFPMMIVEGEIRGMPPANDAGRVWVGGV